jgi:hypothetical protein
MFYKYDDVIKLMKEINRQNLSVVDRLQELMTFMHELAADIRLKPTHISLCPGIMSPVEDCEN